MLAHHFYITGVGVLSPSQSLGHQVERGRSQKGQQKALYVAHEHVWRQILVNQLDFIPEYRDI